MLFVVTVQTQIMSDRHRLEWMSAIKKAIDNSGEGVRYQITQARQRRVQREEYLARRLSNMDIVEQTRLNFNGINFSLYLNFQS